VTRSTRFPSLSLSDALILPDFFSPASLTPFLSTGPSVAFTLPDFLSLVAFDALHLGPSDAVYFGYQLLLGAPDALPPTGLSDALILPDLSPPGISDARHSSWLLRCRVLRITSSLAPLTPPFFGAFIALTPYTSLPSCVNHST
jgi:hypothetical protein